MWEGIADSEHRQWAQSVQRPWGSKGLGRPREKAREAEPVSKWELMGQSRKYSRRPSGTGETNRLITILPLQGARKMKWGLTPWSLPFQKREGRTFLGVQWLRLGLPTSGAWVRSWTGKILRSEGNKARVPQLQSRLLSALCLATSEATAACKRPDLELESSPCSPRRPKAWAQQQRHSTARNKVNSHAEEKKPETAKPGWQLGQGCCKAASSDLPS